jgi:hypothetical protein
MAAAGGQRIEQALEPPQPAAVLGEHPATDRVGQPPEAVQFQPGQEQPGNVGDQAAARSEVGR